MGTQEQRVAKKKPGLLARGCGCLITLVVLVVVLVVAVSLLGHAGPLGGNGGTAWTIQVEGTRGATFTGSYDVVSGGSSTQKSVQGTVPASYQVNGDIVSVAFQKQTGDAAQLVVKLVKDGATVKQTDTTAAYGAVAVASQ